MSITVLTKKVGQDILNKLPITELIYFNRCDRGEGSNICLTVNDIGPGHPVCNGNINHFKQDVVHGVTNPRL